MSNNKNVAYITMQYLSSKWSRAESVRIFGPHIGMELWNTYKHRYYNNPWLFYFAELDEEMRDALTIRASQASLSAGKSEVDALFQMCVWPMMTLRDIMRDGLSKRGEITLKNPYLKHNFPMINGTYETCITSIEYKWTARQSYFIVKGKYKDVEIQDMVEDDTYSIYQFYCMLRNDGIKIPDPKKPWK